LKGYFDQGGGQCNFPYQLPLGYAFDEIHPTAQPGVPFKKLRSFKTAIML